jgi:capsule polysaccharide export protein KpsE/RkpR
MAAALPGQGAGALGGIAGDLLGIKNSGALFTGILQSRTVQDRLIDQFDLKKVYDDKLMEDARESLSSRTSIGEERKSGIITIFVSDKDPNRAAAMAAAYVTELDRLVAQVSTSSARRERIFLEDRLRSVKQDLDAASGKFSEFASKNTAIDIPAQGKAMVEAAARLQGELIAAESELRGLQAIYTPQNVRVRSVQAKVSELRAQLEKLGGGGQDSQGNASMYPSIRKLPVLGVTYADLFRQTKIQETVFELLTRQYELAKVQEAKEIPSVKILDVAVVPTKKSFPPRLLLIAASTFISLLLACVWLLAKDAWKGIPPEDSRKQFALEIGASLQNDFARLAPQASLRARVLARIELIKKGVSAEENSRAKTERAGNQQDVARAAGSSGS